MLRRMFVLYALLPAWLSSLGAAVLLTGTLAFMAWLAVNNDFLIGVPVTVERGTDAASLLVTVRPWGALPERRTIVDEQRYRELAKDDIAWLLAHGRERATTPSAQHATVIAAVPKWNWFSLWLQLRPANLSLPLAALIVGCAVILLGPWLQQLLTAGMLGAWLAFCAWHLLALAEIYGGAKVPELAAIPVAIFALATGILAALRMPRGLITEALSRLVLVIVIYAAHASVAAWFGWAEVTTLGVLIMLTLLSPLVPSAVLGGYFLGVGLHAEAPLSHVLLVASSLIVLLLWAVPRHSRTIADGRRPSSTAD